MDRKPNNSPSEEESNVIKFPVSDDNKSRGDEQSIALETSSDKSDDLDHYRRLNINLCSDNSEVTAFVDAIYNKLSSDENENIKIRKKHLKVILLNLYDAWCDDPDLKIAVYRRTNEYKAKSRYNPQGISRTTINVVDHLEQAKFIDSKIGFLDRVRKIGRISRIWATQKLIKQFKDARFSQSDIGDHEERETIILRNKKKKEIEYEDDDRTHKMRAVLKDYNDLLKSTYIDIPELDESYIDHGIDKQGKPARLIISQNAKFVRRIFNRESFDKGGRFYGGWWQNCRKVWRPKIYINDEPTIEIDYSGFHIFLLYAKEGIDYYKTIGGDPYQVKQLPFLNSEDHAKDCAKLLLLIALNAKNETSAFKAFKNEFEPGREENSFDKYQLSELLSELKNKHEPIKHYIASDAGIDLMHLDAQISEYVIKHCTELNIPVLAIHDSFIVPRFNKKDLHLAGFMIDAMKMATKEILNTTDSERIRFKTISEEGENTHKSSRYKQQFEEFHQRLGEIKTRRTQ